jgi:hypothetical protein
MKKTPSIRRALCNTLSPAEVECALTRLAKSGELVEIYGELKAIIAKKGDNSHYTNSDFIHEFKSKSKVKVLGLPNGAICSVALAKTKTGKPVKLWTNVPQ